MLCCTLKAMRAGQPSYTTTSRTPLKPMLLLLMLRLATVGAIAVDKSDGGSNKLQIEEPAEPLLDHTQSHFLPKRSGIVQLFEWKFADIATECEQFLGPHGFAGVQVSPVAEHLVVRSATVRHPWWERYQPLSLEIVSRSGNEEEFQQMTRTCNEAGVRVYVDVVLNHFAGAYDEETARGQRLLVGYAGSTANASSYDFPALPFTRLHFHKPCELVDYLDAHVVRNCELNGWPDLNHYRLDVRANLTEFLNRLVGMGVAGFRVDAAKYIWPIDIKLLFKSVNDLNSEDFDFPENARPYVYQDVVDLGVDSISKTEYSSYGMVTEYLYAAELANIINGKAPLSSLINWGPPMGFLPHQQALVFVDSHDGQREHELLGANQLLSYRQPRKYIMATAFMLAHPYGRVKRIMSSYYFAAQQLEQGPPMEEGEAQEEVEGAEENGIEAKGEEATDEDATTGDAPPPQIRSPTFDESTGRCEFASGWVCEHRWPPVVKMLELVNTLSELEDGVMNFQTDGPNHIAFCRGNKAFFVFNSDAQQVYDAIVETCLPSGVYCDVISGGHAENSGLTSECAGKRIVVDTEGRAHIILPAAFGSNDEAVGSDYDEADVDAKDAYEIAVGAEGEFGVLAIYEGWRLVDEVQLDKQEAEKGTEGAPADAAEEETSTEPAAEVDAEDTEDVDSITEIADVTQEVVSPEELRDATVEKNAKLEEDIATDASIESEPAVDGTQAEEEADETEGGGKVVVGSDGEEEEGVGEAGGGEPAEEPAEGAAVPVAEDDNPAEKLEEVAEDGEVTAGESEQVETAGVEDEAANAEEPVEPVDTPVDEPASEAAGEAAGEATDEAAIEPAGEAADEAANGAADEAANETPAADETASDEPAPADNIPADENPPSDTADAGETEQITEPAETQTNAPEAEPANEAGIIEQAKGVMEEIENGVINIAHEVQDKIAGHTGKDEAGSTTDIKAGAQNVANKTKDIIAKAGFNTNGAGRSQSIRLRNLAILIGVILINVYST
ncbi:uncharacterized protein LOC128868007 [Anastrepha ludens]|uniref:uncharacterized protein LOC128868007 n=1 Tax=Anastrepha ludens TaxID=28586 RepID=UPI0023B1C3B4|nr:uncharacterized protein LOC128868007 [Anastrepha ludens]